MGIKVRHNGQWIEMGFAGAPGGEPVGTIIAWGGSAANIPSNFRLCNGQGLSRTTYSELFSKLGTIHGSGDGSTTFNIPDLRNKFIVGAKDGGNNNYPSLTVGATGGSANAVVVQHNHSITEPNSGQGHRHVYTAATSIGGHTDDGGSPDQRSTTKNNLNTNYSTTGITINNEGVSGTNANLPPYYALCYIIKIDTSSATGSGVADGDYGDITVSNSGTVWNIDQDTIGPTELIATGVSAGTYTNPSITVDEDGRLTAASSGSAPVTTFLGLSDTPNTYVPSAGKVLVVNNTQNGVEFVDKSTITSGLFQDKITEGDSKAEIIDTATESKFTVEIDAAEKFSVDIGGPKIHRQDSSLEGGSIVFNRAADDVAAFEIDVYGSSSSDSGRFRIIDSTGGGERFAIGPNGEIGLGYVSTTSAKYGTAGQVLTSGGPGAGVTWADAPSGGGGSSDPVGTIVAWAGSVASIPSEYQLCDGGAAATSELQAITGTNVPDLRDKFIVGATNSTGDVTYPGLSPGATGGSAYATLPSHTHGSGTLTAANHRHNFPGDDHLAFANGVAGWNTNTNGTFNMDADSSSSGNGKMWYTTYSGSLSISGSVSTEGASTLNANLPPYYALCYIIKHTATSGSGGSSGDKISEGNTEAEVVDTGSDGHFKVTTEGTERLRVTSNGSVGIGTTTPEGGLNPNPLFGTKLDVFKSFVGGGDGSFVGRFYGLDTNVQETSVRFITKGTGGTAADLYNASDAYLIHGISNGDTKFVFGANGSVGIGSTLPKAKLDVNGTVAIGSSIYDSNGNLGSDGQVLSSVPGIGVSWTDQTGGSSSSSSGGSGFVLLERKSATGTSVEFTGIPADAYEITLMFEGVSGSTATDFDVQLGTSSGYITSNYNSSSEKANGENSSNSTSSFVIRNDDASSSFQGSMIINKSSSNSYSEIGQFKNSSITACETFGSLSSVSGVVDRLKVSIGNGNFDAGLIGLSYKTASSGNSGSSGGGGEPVGTIVAWSGTASNIPTGYQLCDGGSAQTSALQAITGSNVPNLTDRFIIGANDVAAESAYPGVGVGSTGGSANSVVASHSHGTYGSESGYRHAVRAGTDASIDWDSHTASSEDGTYSSNSRTDTAGVDSDGNSDSSQTGTNANLPPYYALCYIIKHTATSGSGGSGFVLEAAKTATGSSVEFTNIPADAYEITLMFNGVSLDGSGSILVELGTSSTYITQGYTATSQTEDGSNEVDVTNAFTIYSASNYLHHGKFDINKFSDTSYTFEGQSRTLNNGGVQAYGSLNGISGTITKLKIRPANTGSGVEFDSGSISISYKTASSGGSSSSGGSGGTVSSGTFTATAGSPSTLESYTYDSAELVFEYTVFVKNGSNYQTQKLLVMRDGTTVDSSQFAVMYSNNLLVQLDATISGSNLLLRATPETGVNGSTTYRIKREVI